MPTFAPSRRAILQGALALPLALPVALSPASAEAQGRAWLGVELEKADSGVLAKRVIRGSPADKSGLRDGNVILTVNGTAVASPREVIKVIQAAGPGATLVLHVERGSEKADMKVTLIEHPGDEEVLRLDKVGTFAPSWKGVKAAKGDVADIKKQKGSVVLVDFWATWCSACRAMTPNLNELHDKFAAQGVKVVGLTDDNEEAALKAANKLGIKYAINVDTSVETLRDYSVMALPTMFVVDKKGVIRHAAIGLQPVEALSPVLKKLIAEPA